VRASAWIAAVALLGAALFGAQLACSRASAPGPSAAQTPGLAADARIAWLLESRTRTEPFLQDTSDLIPALVSKLAHGQSDPLALAKIDLAAAGERALPELRRFFDASYSSEVLAARLINALDTVALMHDGLGRPILLRGLDHPVASVRLAALRGLGRQARPEDFERLKMVASVTGSEGHTQLARALWCSDRARVVRELPAWLEGSMTAQVVLPLGEVLHTFEDRAALLALKPLLPKLAGEFRARLLGALAQAGDAESLAELRSLLADPDAQRRELAAHCLRDSGLQRELLPRLREDGYAPVRVVAAQALSEIPIDDELRAALQNAAGDPSDDVRGLALSALVAAHDPAGENEALELLKGERSELERGLLVLREALKTRRDLAQRALAVLDGLRSGATGTLRVEKSSIWRAISQIPLEAAARILFDELEHEPSPDRNFSAFRWFTTQVGNTGPEGWRLARARWAEESDPARRVDLMNASCCDRGEEGRKFLEVALDSGRLTDLEVLYAAQQLASMGPAERVAPRLKRIALGISDRAVRPALNNLLWTWYGREP
jgi:HEAT repeat protein